jgi:archaemetzincin
MILAALDWRWEHMIRVCWSQRKQAGSRPTRTATGPCLSRRDWLAALAAVAVGCHDSARLDRTGALSVQRGPVPGDPTEKRPPSVAAPRQHTPPLPVGPADASTQPAPPVEAATSPLPRYYLLPLGPEGVEPDVEFARRSLVSFYSAEVVVLPRVPLPRDAYYAPRHRYRADSLLTFLESRLPSDAYRLIGATSVDISTTKPPYADWGILGLATLTGQVCVLSSFRCRRLAHDEQQATVRFGKTAVHEVGHTLGLAHCPTYGCLMEDARGSVLTTDREYDLCARCRKALVLAGHELSHDQVIPWPRPS